MSYEKKLTEMGFTVTPLAPADGARFAPAVRTGNLVFVSGSVSSWEGREIKGKIGGDLSVEQGYEAARFATLNCLRAVKAVAGSLDKVRRIVKVFGMVNVAPGFDKTPDVIHGCSEFLLEVFGDAGKHARSAVGLTLPYNYAVEVEMVVEIDI